MAKVVSKAEFAGQLDRLLKSSRFIRAERRADLLRYLGQHALKDSVPEEWQIAIDVFNRPKDWSKDNGDRIVAVYLSRLRDDLSDHYANDGAHDDVVISIHGRRAVAECRESIPDATAEQLATPILTAGQAFFVAPQGTSSRCVVTGEIAGVAWYPIDGDHRNLSLGNIVPLSGRLRAALDASWAGRRRTLVPQLDPKRLGNKLGPQHFQQLRPASAYGCAALAFSLGSLPCAHQSDHDRAIWLCNAIDYARRHFSSPLIRHVFRHMALPFLVQLERTDASTAVRFALQLTGVLEESGRHEDAQACLDFGYRVSRAAGRSFLGEGTREYYGLLRRRAQLLAERNPMEEKFQGLMEQAREHAAGIEERSLSLDIDRIRRWLRQGCSGGLKAAHESSASTLALYDSLLFQDGVIKPPQRIAAHLGEILLLSGIAACRLRPSGWKSYADERMASARTLVYHAGHVLPTEYHMLAWDTVQTYNASSAPVLRVSSLYSRPDPSDPLATDAALVLKAVAQLRILPFKRAMPEDGGHPDP